MPINTPTAPLSALNIPSVVTFDNAEEYNFWARQQSPAWPTALPFDASKPEKKWVDTSFTDGIYNALSLGQKAATSDVVPVAYDSIFLTAEQAKSVNLRTNAQILADHVSYAQVPVPVRVLQYGESIRLLTIGEMPSPFVVNDALYAQQQAAKADASGFTQADRDILTAIYNWVKAQPNATQTKA